MTANAPNMPSPKGLGTQPVYRAHATEMEPDENFRSVGDNATTGNYTEGGGNDEPIERSLFNADDYAAPFGQQMNSAQRQRGRQWMRKIMQDNFGREI